MARYTGPKNRICRIFGEPILGSGKSLSKNSNPPGQHGPTRKRKAASEYAVQLKEKQKAKYTYGLLEKQFANLYQQSQSPQTLLRIIKARQEESFNVLRDTYGADKEKLDKSKYKLGFADSADAYLKEGKGGKASVDKPTVDINSFFFTPKNP